MPPLNPTVPAAHERLPNESTLPAGVIVSIDTPTLAGAALHLGRRRLSRLERRRLIAQLKARAAAGEATAPMTIDRLECRPDRLLAERGRA